MKWINSSSMKESLEIIDKKVAHLLQQFQVGGESKLIQWFLTDDMNFVTITAERYIIDYLKTKNSNIEDNLRKEGIDAILRLGDEKVGIEVTTLNGFFAEWILIERLSEMLNSKKVIDDKTLRVTYNYERIMRETQQNRMHQYLENMSTAIAAGDYETLKTLEVSIEIERRWSGVISWDRSNADNFPWFRYLTDDLFTKLSDVSKKRQLMSYEKNIIFIGVNHIAPSNWAIPSIFEEIGHGGASYSVQINGIESFWYKIMQNCHYIKGICFFCISIDKDVPFYPLRVLWSDEKEILPINL